MSARGSRGFALIELMVAVGLFALVMIALAALQSFALRNQSQLLGKTSAGNQASLIAKAFQHAMSQASYVQSPSPGSQGTALAAWSNVDPADGTSPILGALPRTLSFFCLDSTQRLLLYQGNYQPADAMPAINNTSCDSGVGGAQQLVIAGGLGPAGGAGPLTVQALSFNYPSSEENFLQAAYTVQFQAADGSPPIQVTQWTELSVKH